MDIHSFKGVTKFDMFTIYVLSIHQTKYKESAKNSGSTSIYSQLPETTETQFVKAVSELQSEVGEDCKLPHEHASVSP